MTDDEAIQKAAKIMADLLSAALMPKEDTWASARYAYIWEREGLQWLHDMRAKTGPINGWTAMLRDEGYPPSKAGADQGKFWKSPYWKNVGHG